MLSRMQENERIAALVRPALKPMLVGHFAAISDKLAPGANVLTWVSMNIDGYLHALHKVGCLSPLPNTSPASKRADWDGLL